MTLWRVTIDQRTPSGGTRRYGPYKEEYPRMSDAVEEAIDRAGLLHVEMGEYQITAIDAEV
jgi:hypothetical protein